MDIQDKKEAMLKRLANRHEQRLMCSAAKETKGKIDLHATEQAFLESSPSTVNMTTPVNPPSKLAFTVSDASSPILSFDEKADKQIIALATWCNIIIGLDASEEVDLGSSKIEACRKIQAMLKKKSDFSEEKDPHAIARRNYQKIFEKNDSDVIRKKCRKLLDDSGMDQSIKNLVSKNAIVIRNDHAIYNDLGLQTTILRVFLSFHPAWSKAALEAIFNTKIDVQPKHMIGRLSQFFIEHVFCNPAMLKNKKFAQGSGKPIITAAGKDALHRHFLTVSMKFMFLIETSYVHRVIPNLTRIFTKTSYFKSLDDVFSELTKELLTGSSLTFRKAFAKIGFVPSYKQSFIENYDYRAKGFSDFSDGIVFAKLLEAAGEMPHGQVLLKLRDPAGDRIRKVNNVKIVLQEMASLGISTQDVTAAAIVGGKKEEILSILWAVIGVLVAKEKKMRVVRTQDLQECSTPKKRCSAVHDDMSSEILKKCKVYGRDLGVEVIDLDSLTDGLLLSKVWAANVPNGTPVQVYDGDNLWEKIIAMAEIELGIQRGLDQNIVLFVKLFLERMQIVMNYNEYAAKIQRMWRAHLEWKKTPKMYFLVRKIISDYQSVIRVRSISPNFSIDNVNWAVPKTPRNNILKEQLSLSQISSERQSVDSTFNNATFTVSRDSIEALNISMKTLKTPLRCTFTKNTIQNIIEEEQSENDETIVPSTLKKRVRVIGKQQFESEEFKVERMEGVTHSNGTVIEENSKLKEDNVDHSENVTGDGQSPNGPITHTIDFSQDLPLNNDPDVTEEAFPSTSSVTNVETDEDTEASEKSFHEPKDATSCNLVTGNTSNAISSNMIESLVVQEPLDQQNIRIYTENVPPKTRNEDVEHLISNGVQFDSGQATDSPSTEFQMSEDQQKITDLFKSVIDDQKNFVMKNKLDVVVNNPSCITNTPELRRILRETRELKRKQLNVAKKLKGIEKNALAFREEAFIESSTSLYVSENDKKLNDDRTNAGRDGAIIQDENPHLECESDRINTEKAIRAEAQRRAAIVIQKHVRRFLVRRQYRAEIERWHSRMIEYNQVLAREDEQFDRNEKKDSSAEKKLERCALHGLTNENLCIVHVAATIIDRITSLVPSLLNKFVVELHGVKLILDILNVADQGLAYTAILLPLLKILRKSFLNVPEDVTNPSIFPLLPELSPRLTLLMCKHCNDIEIFIPIIATLCSIGQRFPNKYQSHLHHLGYAIRQAMKKVTDQEGRNYLITLQNFYNDHIF